VTIASSTLAAPFVRGDAGLLRAVVVVPPPSGLSSVPPTHGESSPIADRALEQFALFTSRLKAFGVRVESVQTSSPSPLASLAADCAVIFEDGAFLMRPSDLARRAAVADVEAALVRAQVPIVGRIEAPGLLDGGDVLLSAGSLFVGVPAPRQAETGIPGFAHGNALGREQLAAYARTKGRTVVEIAMAAEVRRLRSVASFVGPEAVLFAAGLLDGAAFVGLERIVAPRGEDYGAGVLALGPRRVLTNLRFRETIPLLRRAKIFVDAVDFWEFGKIGATPSSMALALKRD
jgi:dimethylargininase